MASERVEGGIPGKLRNGLDTSKQQLDAAALLLEGLTRLGGARTGDLGGRSQGSEDEAPLTATASLPQAAP